MSVHWTSCLFISFISETARPVVPKVWGAPPWGAQELCREKKIERNLHLAIFSELHLPYFLSPGSNYEFHHTVNLFLFINVFKI
jgi:hypothetical protein